jgi:hypothetical protein
MRFSYSKRVDLTEADATIVGWNTLVPVRAQTTLPQLLNSALGEILILETPSCEYDAFYADATSDSNNDVRKHIMELHRYQRPGNILTQILQDLLDCRGPIHHQKRLPITNCRSSILS